MARNRGVDPSKQALLSGLFTRIVYLMTKRKVGRVVMPVQLVRKQGEAEHGAMASSLILSGEENVRNADENSESGHTGNSRSLRWVVKFRQDGTPCLHCVALFASGRLYEAICP